MRELTPDEMFNTAGLRSLASTASGGRTEDMRELHEDEIYKLAGLASWASTASGGRTEDMRELNDVERRKLPGAVAAKERFRTMLANTPLKANFARVKELMAEAATVLDVPTLLRYHLAMARGVNAVPDDVVLWSDVEVAYVESLQAGSTPTIHGLNSFLMRHVSHVLSPFAAIPVENIAVHTYLESEAGGGDDLSFFDEDGSVRPGVDHAGYGALSHEDNEDFLREQGVSTTALEMWAENAERCSSVANGNLASAKAGSRARPCFVAPTLFAAFGDDEDEERGQLGLNFNMASSGEGTMFAVLSGFPSWSHFSMGAHDIAALRRAATIAEALTRPSGSTDILRFVLRREPLSAESVFETARRLGSSPGYSNMDGCYFHNAGRLALTRRGVKMPSFKVRGLEEEIRDDFISEMMEEFGEIGDDQEESDTEDLIVDEELEVELNSSFFFSTGGGMVYNQSQFSGGGMAGFNPRGPDNVEDDDDDDEDDAQGSFGPFSVAAVAGAAMLHYRRNRDEEDDDDGGGKPKAKW
jgi:hypothetical protein